MAGPGNLHFCRHCGQLRRAKSEDQHLCYGPEFWGERRRVCGPGDREDPPHGPCKDAKMRNDHMFPPDAHMLPEASSALGLQPSRLKRGSLSETRLLVAGAPCGSRWALLCGSWVWLFISVWVPLSTRPSTVHLAWVHTSLPPSAARGWLPTWLYNPRMAAGHHTQAWLSLCHSLVLLCGRGRRVGRCTSHWRHSGPSLSLPSYQPFARRNFMTFLLHHVIAQIPWIALHGLWSVFPPVWNLVEVRDGA